MKLYRIVLSVLFTIGLTNIGIAQNGEAGIEEEKLNVCNNTMLQRLENQTGHMKEVLDLSEEQEMEVMNINRRALADLELAKAELKEEKEFEKKVHRIESKRDYQLQNALSRQQFQKYKSVKTNDSILSIQMYKELSVDLLQEDGEEFSYKGHPRASDNEEAKIEIDTTPYSSTEGQEGIVSADTSFNAVCSVILSEDASSKAMNDKEKKVKNSGKKQPKSAKLNDETESSIKEPESLK